MMVFLLLILFFTAVNALMAWRHAALIKDGKKIQHGWWGLLYVAVAVSITLLCKDASLFLMACMNRQLVFDNLLDKLRGYSVTYHSVETTSIIDQIEYLFFDGNWYAETIVYTLLFIASILINIHQWWQW